MSKFFYTTGMLNFMRKCLEDGDSHSEIAELFSAKYGVNKSGNNIKRVIHYKISPNYGTKMGKGKK